MNLKTVFRLGAVVLLINGLGGLFATEMFMEAANFTMSSSLLTIGQFMGVTFLILALIAWRTADIAKDALPVFGQLYAITQGMWTAIIGYHIAIGAAGGPTAYVNIVITALLGILFLFYSKK
tara:strand:- start:24 stop:389 length:366 start_codon:yes stop_codon:yes gene_type:complete